MKKINKHALKEICLKIYVEKYYLNRNITKIYSKMFTSEDVEINHNMYL